MDTQLVKPKYDENGFTSILPEVQGYLLNRDYDVVVLFLVDGFGMRFIEKFQSNPFLAEKIKMGGVKNISAQFPSTTTAHITTLHTGQPVGEHGIYEWYYYEPSLDMVIAPLLFSSAGTSQRDTLKEKGIKPRKIFPQNNFYHALKKQGVQTTIFQHREYTPSSFSDILFDGTQQMGYKTLPEALVNLNHFILTSSSPSYFVIYYDRIDSISHEYGPQSPQTAAEILNFLTTVQSILISKIAGKEKSILFLLTADHGQVDVDPNTTIYLNRDPRFSDVLQWIKKTDSGDLIVPCGSARDFFLHLEDDRVLDAKAMLEAGLKDKADVILTKDLMNEGYFGPNISTKFIDRVGNVVILPYANESVWWYERDKFAQKFHGHHGGLTKEEMEIPLIRWEL